MHPTLNASSSNSGEVWELINDPRLPWSSWAVTQACVRRICDCLESSQARRILEFGGGTSTVFLADYARRCQAEFVSVDHELEFSTKTRELLESFGLEKHVDQRVAPLKRRPCADGHQYFWYDVDLRGPFDFVLIDGPPANFGRQAGLFAIAAQLADSWRALLHDGNRDHEQACVALWRRYFRVEIHRSLQDGRGFLELSSAAGAPRLADTPRLRSPSRRAYSPRRRPRRIRRSLRRS